MSATSSESGSARMCRFTLLLVIGLSISGCGSQASSADQPAATQITAAASPTSGPGVVASPPPTPSPAPDPADLLMATLSAPDREWRIAIEGTESVPSGMTAFSGNGSPMPIGSQAPMVLHYEGEAWVVGSDFVLRLQVPDSPKVVISELRLGTDLRRRDYTHPWQELPAPSAAAPQRLFDLLGALTSLEPAGEVDLGGESLLRYRAPASTGLGLVTISLQEESTKQPDSGTVELVARPDGTPVQATVHLTSDDFDYSEALPSGMAIPPRTYDFTYTFEDASGLTLPDPTAAMARYQSRFGLSLEHPAGWQADTTEDNADVLALPGSGRLLVILRFATADLQEKPANDEEALDAFSRWVAGDIQTEMAIKSIETTTVDGLPAYVFAAATDADAEDPYLRLEAALVSGDSMYSIFQLTPLGAELSDRYAFDRILASVQLDE